MSPRRWGGVAAGLRILRGISATAAEKYQRRQTVFQALPGWNFIVNGAAPPHNSALLSAGAELRVRPDWSFSAKFDGEFASGAQTYSGVGTVRYSW